MNINLIFFLSIKYDYYSIKLFNKILFKIIITKKKKKYKILHVEF